MLGRIKEPCPGMLYSHRRVVYGKFPSQSLIAFQKGKGLATVWPYRYLSLAVYVYVCLIKNIRCVA